ncbi:MAG: RelA/SpoT domain-containing protein, partial [archaeon]
DYNQIKNDFKSLVPTLKIISDKLEKNLLEIFKDVEHIDKISCRIKDESSFLNKTLKEKDGVLKYTVPLKEIQDLVGARVVVYYKSDVDAAQEIIKKFYQFVEKTKIIPDDVNTFGYEGVHFICFIPSPIFSCHKSNPLIPDFFELQIKTLYQHAWSQAEHGLGYKPENPLSYEEQRKLAFLAAQSWGADSILMDLLKQKN